MKKMMILTAAIAFLFCMAGTSFAVGQANIVLKGGFMGPVHFPHALHQKTLKNCNLCHHKFPMEKGAIEKGMASGKLKKQEVMKMCEDCHKKDKAKGVKAGPTTCRGCHKK